MNTMKITLTLAAFLYPTNADGLPKWSLADIDGCLETSINIPALKLTKFGTGIDGASTFNISRATCVEKGYTNQTKAFFGEGNDMPTLVKAAYSGVTWWKKQQSTTAADVSVIVSANKCPDVQPIEGLNLTKWTEKTWYVAQQQLNGYQKPSELFCTLASYNVNTTKKIPFFKGTVLNVHNYENVDEINGKIENTDINIPSGLCARAKNASRPSELLVAPCFLPNIAAGPYWIIAVGETNQGEYSWGVIAGGKPTVQYADGCSTKETGVNGSGLWIFVRNPTNDGSSEVVKEARAALVKLGYTLSRLLDVKQDGCKYEGAIIKN